MHCHWVLPTLWPKSWTAKSWNCCGGTEEREGRKSRAPSYVWLWEEQDRAFLFFVALLQMHDLAYWPWKIFPSSENIAMRPMSTHIFRVYVHISQYTCFSRLDFKTNLEERQKCSSSQPRGVFPIKAPSTSTSQFTNWFTTCRSPETLSIPLCSVYPR